MLRQIGLWLCLFGTAVLAGCPTSKGYGLDQDGKCVKQFTVYKSRLQALKTCQDDDAILYVPRSAAENGHAQQTGSQLGAFFWLGMTCAGNTSSQCLDDEGTALSYANFAGSAGSNANGACAQLQVFSGQWFSTSCSATAAPFICQYTGNQNIESCEPGFWLFNHKCYRAVPPDFPYTSEELCANYDGLIATIHSVGEQNFVFDVAHNSFGLDNNIPFYRIGMAVDNNMNMYWIDGSPVNYTTKPPPLVLPGKNCMDVSMDGQIVGRGQWVSGTCHSLIPTVCKKAATIPGPQTSHPSALCSSGINYSNQTFYSPNYPGIYVSESCDSLIRYPQGMAMYMQFTELYLDKQSYINLYEDINSATPTYKIDWTASPLQVYSFVNGGGLTKFEFEGNNNQKANARWRAISTTVPIQEYLSAGPKCDQQISYYGQFTTNLYNSLNSTQNISPACNITFLAKSGGYRASLAFNDFYIGPNDRVTFYDGKDSTAPVIGKSFYSGAQPGLSIEATQQYLRMEVSDISIGYRGIWGSFYSN